MMPRIPRWLLITLIVTVIAAIVTGLVFLIIKAPTIGWIVTGILLAAIVIVAIMTVPQFIKLYKFNKYFKENEAQLSSLPALMQSGRTQEALSRFDGVMKHAPENAYIFYMKAHFLQAAGKQSEALASAQKALTMADKDPYLQTMLQQSGGQMGQPSTVTEFKSQLHDMIVSLEPRVAQMRQRREKAVKERKKKSR